LNHPSKSDHYYLAVKKRTTSVQEFQLPGIKLLAFDSEDPTDEQIDFFFEQLILRF
jgi:hypothetical protein